MRTPIKNKFTRDPLFNRNVINAKEVFQKINIFRWRNFDIYFTKNRANNNNKYFKKNIIVKKQKILHNPSTLCRKQKNESGYIQRKLFLTQNRKVNSSAKQKSKTYFISTNILFLLGGGTSLCSVFVYDFLPNRLLQILANFFFLSFHITRTSINLIASFIHFFFIFFSIVSLASKKRKAKKQHNVKETITHN